MISIRNGYFVYRSIVSIMHEGKSDRIKVLCITLLHVLKSTYVAVKVVCMKKNTSGEISLWVEQY